MLTIDLSPRYHSVIGLDRLAEACDIAARMAPAGDPYPPHDIEKIGALETGGSQAAAGSPLKVVEGRRRKAA